MDKTNARVLQLMEELGISKSELAREIEVSPSIISHITSGRNKIGLDVLQKISQTYPQISANWLLNGTGAMKESQDSTRLQNTANAINGLKNQAENLESQLAVLIRALKGLENDLK